MLKISAFILFTSVLVLVSTAQSPRLTKVTVQVVNPAGFPIADAWVGVRSRTHDFGVTATNTRGTTEWALSPGIYSVKVWFTDRKTWEDFQIKSYSVPEAEMITLSVTLKLSKSARRSIMSSS